ncbi:hypothetical protein RJT34_03132 [Clitoria ternatea]|uniref:Uncharacterized protein n=1 Tax=Clitoria ternatea TaxID=43366 RepID=A0AAN9KL64_CLITE
MVFEGFDDDIFSEPKVEWASHTTLSLGPFFFHAHASDSSHFVIHVFNFNSDTWQARLTHSMLEDIRDIVGIAGSWSEFTDYFVTSLKSENLKLVLEPNSNSDGVSHAKLVAQKSKGMPLITVPLSKVVDSTAREVQSNSYSSLFKAFKTLERSLVEEREHSAQLTKVLATEKERNEAIQLEQQQKFQKIGDSEKGVSSDGVQNSPDKQAARDTDSTRVKNRTVPAYRRTKIRGALLHDSDK